MSENGLNFYKQIIESSEEIISVFNKEGKCLFVSNKLTELTAHSPDEVKEKHFSMFLSSSSTKKVQSLCYTLPLKKTVKLKHSILDSKGREIYVESAFSNMGSTIVVKTTKADHIHEEFDEMIRAENLWLNLANNIPDYITIVNSDGIIVYTNHLHPNLKESDVIGVKFTEFFLPDQREAEWNNFQHAIHSREVMESEKLVCYPDGHTLWFNSSVAPLVVNDKIMGAIVVSKNITEQKTREHSIKESEERFRQLVESANDIIYRTDFKGNFVYINPEASRIFGHTLEDLKNLHYSVLIRDDYIERLSTFYSNQFKNRTPNTYYEFPMISKEGKEIWLGQNVQILTDGDWVLGFQALARDITIRKRIEAELKLAKKDAEESSKAKQEFLSTMSHEIRTPLNAVIGLTNLLSNDNTDKAEQDELIQGIKISADNLLHIINDILDFSKIESGKFSLEDTPFVLDELVNSIKQSFITQAEEKGLELIFHNYDFSPGEESPLLQGDPIRISQILLNLISNAIKFTNQGKITVDVSTEPTSTEEVWLKIKVSDTGIGISQDQLNTIFDSFTQASKSTTRKYGGSGLGLTITNMLVRMMKGTIKVDSAPNKGSVFDVNLKLRKATIDNLPEVSIPEEDNIIEGKNILLVEDNQMNQLVASRYMKRWLASVDVANNGIDAIELLKKKRYDIILMDLEMPDMDGYETTRYIRNRLEKPYNEIPIIAITASAFVSVKEKVLRFGMNDYVTKPFDPKSLRDKISRALNGTSVNDNDDTKTKSTSYISPDGKLFNLSYLMEASAGDFSFVEKMIKTYVNNTPKYLDDLKKCMMQNNFYELKRVAHKFKATVTIVGVKEIELLIDELEENIMKNKHLEKLPMIVENIITKGNKSVLELQEEINQSI